MKIKYAVMRSDREKRIILEIFYLKQLLMPPVVASAYQALTLSIYQFYAGIRKTRDDHIRQIIPFSGLSPARAFMA